MKLAVDTNLLAHETPRRFLRNITQHLGIPIYVLPQVHEEALRRIERQAIESWTDRLDDLTEYDDAQRALILSAAGGAAREWLDEQCRQQGTGLVLVRPELAQQWDAHRIARNLPPGIVKKGLDGPPGDPLILAQSAVHGMTLLSTNNFKTIHHDAANDWFKDVIGVPQPVVRMPDETIDVLAHNNRATANVWTLAYAPDWTRDTEALSTGGDAVRTVYETALDRVQGAGFITTARNARWTYENEHNEPGKFESAVRDAIKTCQLRDADRAEQQRHEAIRTAAKNAGFER